MFYEPRMIPGKSDAMDVLYEARNDVGEVTMRVYIELRNLRIEDLTKFPFEVPYDWSEKAKAWPQWLAHNNQLSVDDLSVRAPTKPDWDSYKDRYAPTVGEYVQKAAKDVKEHYVQHISMSACTVWLLVRVGVGLVMKQQLVRTEGN